MKNLQKIILACFLIGGMLTSALITQGHAPITIKENNTNVTNAPDISAGADATICSEDGFKTKGVAGYSGMVYWSTSGDGVFKDPYSLKAFYIPGPHDIHFGHVTLTLHVVPMGDIIQKPIQDEMVLNLNKCKSGIIDSYKQKTPLK